MYRWMNKLARKAINFVVIGTMLCAFLNFISEGGYFYSLIVSIIYGGASLLIMLLLFGQKVSIRNDELIIQTGILRRVRRIDDLSMINTLEYVHSKNSIDRRRLLFAFKDPKDSIELRIQPINEALLVDVLEVLKSVGDDDLIIGFKKKDGKWATK